MCHNLDIQPSTRTPVRVLSWLSIAALLSILSLAMHADLVRHLSSGVPADLGDPLLNTWILWWNAQQLPLTGAYWDAPAFAPMPRALALSETLLGVAWLTTPLQWLGASPLAAYNVLYVLEPVLNGVSAYWLCLVLTARRDAAVIGALAVAFAPYHATQVSHIQTRALFFMPIALGALHRYWTSGRARWLVLLAAATALNAVTCGYFLLFFSILLALVVSWMLAATRDLQKFAMTIGALAVSMLAITPVIVMFRSVRAELGLVRGLGEIERNSADAASWLLGSRHLSVWQIETMADRPEHAAYPGLVLVFLIAVGATVAIRGRVGESIRAESKWLLALLALAAAGILAGVTVIPRPYKVISAGLYLGALAILASKPFRAQVRAGSVPALYAVGLIAAVALSFGPVGRAFGHRFWYKPPYSFLIDLPGFDSARVPALFASIAVICLAVLAAFAIRRVWPVPSRASYVATAAIGALIVADGWFRVPVVAAPAPAPAALSAELVIELPAYGWVEHAAAMYRGMSHGRPLINGYSGYVPPRFEVLQRDLFKDCVKNLDAYREGRSIDAVVWKDAPAAAATDAQLREMWPGAVREETAAAIVYRQPRTPASANGPYLNRCQ